MRRRGAQMKQVRQYWQRVLLYSNSIHTSGISFTQSLGRTIKCWKVSPNGTAASSQSCGTSTTGAPPSHSQGTRESGSVNTRSAVRTQNAQSWLKLVRPGSDPRPYPPVCTGPMLRIQVRTCVRTNTSLAPLFGDAPVRGVFVWEHQRPNKVRSAGLCCVPKPRAPRERCRVLVRSRSSPYARTAAPRTSGHKGSGRCARPQADVPLPLHWSGKKRSRGGVQVLLLPVRIQIQKRSNGAVCSTCWRVLIGAHPIHQKAR